MPFRVKKIAIKVYTPRNLRCLSPAKLGVERDSGGMEAALKVDTLAGFWLIWAVDFRDRVSRYNMAE